jgi:benzil reductase ((S)-benzoin forming)
MFCEDMVALNQLYQLPEGMVVVSGASRGIGHELVNVLLASGIEVVALSRQRCKPSENLTALSVDLSDETGLNMAIETLKTAIDGRPVAGLVNGAGSVKPLGALIRQGTSDLQRALCLMAVAPLQLAAAIAPHMPAGGRILNLSSRSAQATFPGLGAYCMSKHALHAVTESLQHELGPQILVEDLIPGEVDTGMQAELREADPEEFPLVSFFRGNSANLIPADLAARFCHWVLAQTSAESFTRSEPWFIYDQAHHHFWLDDGADFPYTAP